MKQPTVNKLAFQGVTVLTPAGWVQDATVLIADGKFASVDQAEKPEGYTAIAADGLWMLPGIIDVHGDAFERKLYPRPGVHFPLDMAMAENDRSLLAAGITTFFCAITDSYEPGLRSRETATALIDWILGAGQDTLLCNHRIHIRHELANTEGHDVLCNWISSGQVHLISLNDHLPPPGDESRLKRHLRSLKQRMAQSEEELIDWIAQVQAQRDAGLHQVKEIIDLAHQYRVPLASHDDDSEAKVELSRQRQVAIAEFPGSLELAAKSRASGAAVVMGAPNLIRGGSHVGYMSVADAVKEDVVDILCSDYHYPSLFHAPYKLAELGLMPFEQAWDLVSRRPAKAVGLGDRKGTLAPGFDADFLLVSSNSQQSAKLIAVYIAGQPVVQYRSLY